jgi:malate dehydrogenase
VTGHKKEALAEAVTGADIVVIPAGVPRKPGMTRDDLFNTNASIVAELTAGVAKSAPKARILIISNPVNSTVPIAAEVLKKAGVYDPKRLFGVTTLDVLRASTFVAESQAGWDPRNTDVTVIGGHAGTTILPLLSTVKGVKLTQAQIEALTFRIQFGGDEVVKAKDGAGSATLSMAYAADRFTGAVLRAMKGEKGVSECAFVESGAVPGLAFFSTRISIAVRRRGEEEGATLGVCCTHAPRLPSIPLPSPPTPPRCLQADGTVGAIAPVGTLSAYEQAGLDKAIPELKASIAKGVEFAAKWAPK